MRLAALSDIHGNLSALEAVLADLRRRGIDQIVNLGDILSGALYPRETAEFLMQRSFLTIRGNHERQVRSPARSEMSPSDRHAAEALGPEHERWLDSLPATAWLGPEVLLVHGTPSSDLQFLLETVTPDGMAPATEAEISERLGATTATLVLCGHSHVPRVVRLPGGTTVVNPGSVGLQAFTDDLPFPYRVQNGSPHARYAVLERTAAGWEVEACEVEYDWEAAARVARANARPDWERALRTGLA